MLTRAQKEAQIAELKDQFGRATGVFVADYRGLTVDAANTLRSRLKSDPENPIEYRVAKNSVLRRAVAGSSVESLSEHLVGPTAIAISFGDPVGLAKVLVGYSKENEVFELKGGSMDGQALGPAEIATIATLPSLNELRGKLVGLLQAPATKLVRLLAEPGAQLARLVEARRGALDE